MKLLEKCFKWRECSAGTKLFFVVIKMMCGVTDFHWVVPELFPKYTKCRLVYFAANFIIIIFVFSFEKYMLLLWIALLIISMLLCRTFQGKSIRLLIEILSSICLQKRGKYTEHLRQILVVNWFLWKLIWFVLKNNSLLLIY